ncbi:hypothetical protein AB0L65_03550 [Nonomuraea sp. NPDC052116]|uniref:hypothetical protein n=1 Tax=Nonomuraea sp. NPDC052116 TaxID=3155665 RepID=UPI00342C93E7
MRRRTHIAAGIGIAAALAVAGFTVADFTDRASAQRRPVELTEADDRLPSTTATDWVTYADHVVVVNAASEQTIPPNQTDVERGEGLIGRKVSLEVKNVLWSREGAAQPAPKEWEYYATGWTFTNRDVNNPTVLAGEGRPRIEPGHQYILAIAWEGPRCAEGDAPEPGRWMGLGEGSELPFDGDVIGQGEMEGRTQSVAEARTAAAEADPNIGLEEEMVGNNADALAAKLKATPPGERQQFGPQATASCG